MKRLLTPEFVNEVSPPEKGERWIADTKVKNFGLRLWATKSGGSKAFCIRVGTSKRKTYDPYSNPWFSFNIRKEPDTEDQLGAYLNQARNWAAVEIQKINAPIEKTSQLRREDQENREYFQTHIKKMTLEQAAISFIEGRKKQGFSIAYTDQIDSLFHKWDEPELKETPLTQISPKQLAKTLVNQKYAWGNIRVLRMFFGQVFNQAFKFDACDGLFSEKLGETYRKEMGVNYTVKYPELIGLDKAIYKKLFVQIENNSSQWQQAMCIRLFFEFGAPLTRLMSARWCEIHDGYWYPYAPDERSLWFEAREVIREPARILLDKLANKVKDNFGQSDYWFPSPDSKSVPHITTVSRLWKKSVNELGFEEIPLKEFAMTKRNPTNLSYLGYFLSLEKTILAEEKKAFLSKGAKRLNKKAI